MPQCDVHTGLQTLTANTALSLLQTFGTFFQFYVAAVINNHRFGGLELHPHVTSQSWGRKSWGPGGFLGSRSHRSEVTETYNLENLPILELAP